MEGDSELNIKRVKLMNPYVPLNKAFVINSIPSIVKQFNVEKSADVKVILGTSEQDTDNEDNNKVLYLHKIILTSGSPMFSAWLNNYSEKSDMSVLRLPESYNWMPDFFRYFYTGQLMMTSDNIVDIYMIADKYLVENLKIQCEDNIKECLKIKLDKVTCSHLRPLVTKSNDDENMSLLIANMNNYTNCDPYQSFLSSRCAISSSNNVNIFSNFNQFSSIKPITSIGAAATTTNNSNSSNSSSSSGSSNSNSSNGNSNANTGSGITSGSAFNINSCSSNNGNNIVSNSIRGYSNNTPVKCASSGSSHSPNVRSTVFNNIFGFPMSKNLFSKSLHNMNSETDNSISTSFNGGLDLFCEKCVRGPLSVSRVLAFDTLIRLTRITNNVELRKLALYNIIIRMTEEIRVEDYSNFIGLPFELLCELLENDNFYCTEFHLFCGIKQWIKSAVDASSLSSSSTSSLSVVLPNDLQEKADHLIRLIRFPVMSIEDLYDVECSARASGYFSEQPLESLLYQALRFIVYRGVQKAKLEQSWLSARFKPRFPSAIVKLLLG